MSAIELIRADRPIDLYRNHRSGLTEAEFRSRCRGQPIWHSVDLGDLFVEGLRKNSEVLARETSLMHWPDLRGKSVLDIGAFTGWFSFEAERRGAASVTSIDYYSWAIDWPRFHTWQRTEREAGRTPNPYAPPAHVVDETDQPGRRVFDATREILGSKVRSVLAKAEEFESDPFDVVLYLGVLYHCESPLLSLRKVADLTRDQLIIETHGVYLPGLEDRPVWDFFGDDSVNNDPTTWWAPNDRGLIDMLKSVGFRRVEIKSGVDQIPPNNRGPQAIRIWAHAWKSAD